MNEIGLRGFDYSTIDSDTANYLKDREDSMSKTLEGAVEKLGEDLYKAQQKLAKKGYGNFEAWYTSLGLKTSSVYRYINRYKFVSSKLEDSKMIEIFQDLPPSLKNEMSKPSANEMLNQKVFDGDITQYSEYKKQEKELKEQKKINQEQEKRIRELENRKPKEVVPHDYSGLKSDNQQLSRALQQAQSELERTRSRNKAIEEERNRLRSQMQDMGEKSAKYDEMNEAMKQMNGQLDAGQQKLKAQKEIYDLVKNAETLIREIAPLTYLINGEEILNNEYARKPVEKIVDDLRDMADRLESSIEKQILEGVIINE